MNFETVGEPAVIEPIAAGTGIRESERLRKNCGKGRWQKGRRLSVPRADRFVDVTLPESIQKSL